MKKKITLTHQVWICSSEFRAAVVVSALGCVRIESLVSCPVLQILVGRPLFIRVCVGLMSQTLLPFDHVL